MGKGRIERLRSWRVPDVSFPEGFRERRTGVREEFYQHSNIRYRESEVKRETGPFILPAFHTAPPEKRYFLVKSAKSAKKERHAFSGAETYFA